MSKLEEIVARYRGERYRNGDFAISSVVLDSREVSIKGDSEPGELEPNHVYRFYGKWTKFRDGKTFAFKNFVVSVPHDRKGVVAYLAGVGKGQGLGEATADRIYSRLGSDAVKTIRETPAMLRDFSSRITQANVEVIAIRLEESAAVEDATIELTNLLAGRGFPKTVIRKAVKQWGSRAAKQVHRDPYCLIRFAGVGFRTCDALYIELGHDPAKIKRQAMAAWSAAKELSAATGNTWHDHDMISQAIRQTVGSDKAKTEKAILLACRLGDMSPGHYGALAMELTHNDALVDEWRPGCQRWIASRSTATAETKLAGYVINAISEPTKWPCAEDIDGISQHQKEQLAKAMSTPIGLLGGGPGTGKTYATAMLIRHMIKTGIGAGGLVAGSPTGKAAVRVSEALEQAKAKADSRTHHSWLKMNSDGTFDHGEKNRWPFAIYFGDESSMNDLILKSHIVGARRAGCQMMLVGDVKQLSPVGAGAPLRDMIASKAMGYGELTEIIRNSGGIAEACQAIANGHRWEPGDNLEMWQSNSTDAQLKSAFKLIDETQAAGFDPVWDLQLVIALNEKSKVSRKELNPLLQARLNPNKKVAGSIFRDADKIVCLSNGKYRMVEDEAGLADEDGNVRVMNGEIGRVIAVQEKSLVVEMNSPNRLIFVPRKPSDKHAGCDFDLAYAMTCHKLQGSESPIVGVIIDERAGRVCDRSWIYTAISRAKMRCVLIGKRRTIDSMCRKQEILKRKTFLRERLQRGRFRMFFGSLAT